MSNPLLNYFNGIRSENKLCKNCQHCKISFYNKILLGWEGSICTSPNKALAPENFIDVVTGEVVNIGKFNLCVTNRFLACGPQARYYQERESIDLIKSKIE